MAKTSGQETNEMNFIPFATPFHIFDYPGIKQIPVLAFALCILYRW
jgi:hypothetical protein